MNSRLRVLTLVIVSIFTLLPLTVITISGEVLASIFLLIIPIPKKNYVGQSFLGFRFIKAILGVVQVRVIIDN